MNQPDNPLQQVMAALRELQEGMRAVRAGRSNERLRAHNRRALSLWPQKNLELRPLLREQPAADGGAVAGGDAAASGGAAGSCAVAGALPPAGVLPATCQNAHAVGAQRCWLCDIPGSGARQLAVATCAPLSLSLPLSLTLLPFAADGPAARRPGVVLRRGIRGQQR